MKYTLFVLTVSCILMACCKEDYEDIPVEKKQWLPYPEGDLVRFKHSATGQEMVFKTFQREYSQWHGRATPCPDDYNKSEQFDLVVEDSIPLIQFRCGFLQSSKFGFTISCGPFSFFDSSERLGVFNVMGTDYQDVAKSAIIPDSDDRYSACYLSKGVGIIRLNFKDSPDYLYLVQ